MTLCAAASSACAHGLGVCSGGPAEFGTPEMGDGGFSFHHQKNGKSCPGKTVAKGREVKSVWLIRSWLQEVLNELWLHSVLPRLCSESGGTARVGCSCQGCALPVGKQSKALIKAAIRSRSVLGGKWRSFQSVAVWV